MSEQHLGEDLLAFAEGGEALPPARREALRLHLAGCADCQQALAETQRVLRWVERLPAIEPSPSFARALERRLDALDAEAQGGFWARLKEALTLPRLAGVVAVAAAAVIAVLLLRADPEPTVNLEVLEVAERLELYQDLEVVEDLDVLEDLDTILALEEGEPG